MKVITYIDGFNLFHSIKELGNEYSHLKWYNPIKLSKRYLAKNDDVKVKFFTAYPTWHEKQEALKQHEAFVEFLKDLGVSVIFGEFKKKNLKCPACGTAFIKHEEKQTDVNIAVEILRDVYGAQRPDIVQLISGDTDLIPPLRAVKGMVEIHVVKPINRNRGNAGLNDVASKTSSIKKDDLVRCFLGETYKLKNGKILVCIK